MMISDEQIIQDGEVEWVYLSHQLQKEGEAEEVGRHNVNSERWVLSFRIICMYAYYYWFPLY